MLRRVVLFGLLIPLAIVLIMFAVANREVVTVSFDPFEPTQPAVSLRMPLFLLIFVTLIAGVVLGGFAAWLRQGRYRRATRGLRNEMAGLRREVETLTTRLDLPDDRASQSPPPAGVTRMSLQPPVQ
ncbi:MAG: LapA family protein [Pseudorhodoplanes sp.]|nr:LapA family protein [Pseudorhodoplanes sp.]